MESIDSTVGTIGKPQTNLRTCARCGLTYDWRRSPSSSLKMTYCGSLCEKGDLGFTIEALLRVESPKREAAPAEPNPARLVAA
jgi:hypothetical protein